MKYQTNKERKESQFFIDREGKCHKYKGKKIEDVVSVHYEIAKMLHPEIEYPNSPDKYLIELGWVLVGSSVYNCPIIHKKPTQAQINTLFDLDLFSRLCFLYKNTYPNYEKYQALCE